MKTPREILLDTHRAAEPKLDEIRRAVLGQLDAPHRPSVLLLAFYFPRSFWCEVVWPARRIWTGFAAVWALILSANLDFHADAPRMTGAVSSDSAGFLMSPREQEELMAAFNGRAEPVEAEPPKRQVPQPRTERRADLLII